MGGKNCLGYYIGPCMHGLSAMAASKPTKERNIVFKRLFVSGALVLVGITLWTLWFALRPLSLPQPSVEFVIRPGSGLRVATRQIMDAGVPLSSWQFNLMSRVSGNAAAIKAGSYEVSQGTTPWALLGKITRGEFSMSEIVFIEGWTFRQIRMAMQAQPSLLHD